MVRHQLGSAAPILGGDSHRGICRDIAGPADISAHAQTRDDQPASSLILAPAVDWPNKRRPRHLPTGRRARLSSARARDWQLTIFTAGQRYPLTNQQSELFSKLRSIISTLAPA